MILCVFGLLGVNTLVIGTVSIKQVIHNKKIASLKKSQAEYIRQRDIALSIIDTAIDLNFNFYKLQRPE